LALSQWMAANGWPSCLANFFMNLSDIIDIALQLTAVLIAVVFHEVAHGYIAFRLGDPTAKSLKRLSLNPIRHIDPIGTIILPGILALLKAPIFGFAKPVPVNPMYFKNPYQGMMWVAIGGPITNYILAALSYGVLWIITRFDSLLLLKAFGERTELAEYGVFFLAIFFIINILLGTFNLIPIPPLDGSRVLAYFLPTPGRNLLRQIERYGLFIVLGLMAFGLLQNILEPIVDAALWMLEQLINVS